MSNPPVRLDPVRVTEAAAIGSRQEVIVIFKRAVYVEDGSGNPATESAPSAAVAMTWDIARHIRDQLTQMIEQRDMAPPTSAEILNAAKMN